jgi:hypothetical protein
MAQNSEVLRGMPLANTAFVLTEGDVECPMEDFGILLYLLMKNMHIGPAGAFEQKGTVLNGRCSPRRVARLMVCRLGAADVETAGNGRV